LANRGAAALNGGVELLPREEVTLLLASLTACGFLVLGILDVLWPSGSPRRAAANGSKTPAASAAASRAAVGPPRPLPAPPSAVSIGRLLLERARVEKDLERRVTILTRAVAGLTRSAQTTPDDGELTAVLATARTLLWQTWEQIALARLAAVMPWNGEHIAAITPGR
jgi:hypothetical protein